MLSAYVCANGAIATGSVVVATRYFQESSNRNLVEAVGIEPTVFLMWVIYSHLPSPLSTHLQNV